MSRMSVCCMLLQVSVMFEARKNVNVKKLTLALHFIYCYS